MRKVGKPHIRKSEGKWETSVLHRDGSASGCMSPDFERACAVARGYARLPAWLRETPDKGVYND
jgi:hypothetical protein